MIGVHCKREPPIFESLPGQVNDSTDSSAVSSVSATRNLCTSRLLPRPREYREEYRRQDSYDSYHYEEFYQCEPTRPSIRRHWDTPSS